LTLPAFGDTLSVDDYKPKPSAIETVFVEKQSGCAYGQDEILSFANELFELGDYARASVEYLRYNFLYPDGKCATTALFRAALCKERVNEYEQARTLYRELGALSDDRARAFASYRLPLTYFLENELFLANAAIDTSLSAEAYGALQYLRGWILLRQRKYAEAGDVFNRIAQSSQKSDIEGSLNYLSHRCMQGERLPHRYPFIAGFLSAVVPGLGRGYCGHWGDGFFSLTIIGITSGLSFYLWDSDPTFSCIMAGIAGFFYLGNIYGSAKGAVIYNEEKQEIFWRTTWAEVPHPPRMLYSELPCERGE